MANVGKDDGLGAGANGKDGEAGTSLFSKDCFGLFLACCKSLLGIRRSKEPIATSRGR